MPVKVGIPSFASGEASPNIYSRVDIDRYKISLKTCKNFIPHPHGGVSNRSGLKYRATAKNSDKISLCVDHIFSNSQAYVLEFGEEYVRFYTTDGQIQNEGSAYEVSTPYQESDLRALRFESSADVIYIFSPDFQTRTLSRYGDANWVLETYAPNDGPFMPENTDESVTLNASATTGNVEIAVPSGIDTNKKIVLNMNGPDTSTAFTDECGHVFTAFGGAQISTAKSKFGGAAGVFDPLTTDYVSTPDSTDWDLQANNFTLHGWTYKNSSADYMATVSQFLDSSNHWMVYFKDDEFIFSYKTGVTTHYSIVETISDISGGWHHWAIVQSASNLYMFIDGVLIAAPVALNGAPATIANTLDVGRRANGAPRYQWDGYMDDIVLTYDDLWTTTFNASSLVEATNKTTQDDFIFTNNHVGGLFKLSHFVEGQSESVALAATGTGTGILCFTTWRLITHGTWTAKFRVEKSTDGGTVWTTIRTFTGANDYNADTFGTENPELNEEPFLIRINCYSYTGGTLNADLTSDSFYNDGITRITTFNSSSSVNADVLQDFWSTDDTALWSEGSWSDHRGWPSIGLFQQDRLFTSATDSEPMNIWASKTSLYDKYGRNPTSLLDTDSISINLLNRKLNAINGIIALKELLLFTSSSEWKVGATNDIYTPTTMTSKAQGYRGSSGAVPVIIGNSVLYVQNGGNIVRNLAFQLEDDGFSGSDLTVLSDHLFEGKTVVEMAYQQTPESILWCVMDDGGLLSLTYMPEQEVVAWARHETEGVVESICVIPSTDFDEVWITVNRDTGRFVESFVNRMASTDPEDQMFLDSAVSYEGVPAQTFTGMDHLIGESVVALADGVVHDPVTVNADGSITLNQSASVVHAGLAYTSDFETLNVEVPVADGTLQGRKVKISEVTARLLKTRGGYIGPDSDNLYEALTTQNLSAAPAIDDIIESTFNTSATALYSCDLRVPLGGGYKNGGNFFIRQTDPLPITIGAVIPEVTIPKPDLR